MSVIVSSTPKLRVECAGNVARLVVNNASRKNAFGYAMWRAIPGIVSQIEASAEIRVLVVTGDAGLPFCSGADISEFTALRASAESGVDYEQASLDALYALSQLSKPTLAAISGYCLGGGVGLAVACDLRICAQDAVFSIPAGKLGVGYPPSAMKYVVSAVGAQTAFDLFYTARRIDAGEAQSCGLVSRLLPTEGFDAAAMTLANEIAANAPLTLKAAKAAIACASGLPGAPSPEACERLASDCFDSEDYAEGRSAFLGKRLPNFAGR